MWLQSSILQLHFHSISQFLKLGIREPIWLRFVVERNLERFRHASHDRGLHEHPFAIGREELEVGRQSPLVRAPFREEIAKTCEASLNFSGAMEQIVQGFGKPFMIR